MIVMIIEALSNESKLFAKGLKHSRFSVSGPERHAVLVFFSCPFQPPVCAECRPGTALLLENFSDEQEFKKEVACDNSGIPGKQHESARTVNTLDAPESQPVRPYSSVPDLTRQNSSRIPEQYNSSSELIDTISNHHSATNVCFGSRVSKSVIIMYSGSGSQISVQEVQSMFLVQNVFPASESSQLGTILFGYNVCKKGRITLEILLPGHLLPG